MGFKIESDKYYRMPLFAHALYAVPHGPTTYHDVITLGIGYLTDKEKIERLLPEPFEVAEPIVSVYLQCNKKVEWLRGGGYNLIGVDVRATFKGKRDTITGNYNLVMWENLTSAIIGGREQLGVPKLYAEIPDPVQVGSTWYGHAESNGLVFLEMEITDIQPTEPPKGPSAPWLGWKYIPKIDGPGADVSYATLIEVQSTVEGKKAWTGKGTIKFRKTSPEVDPIQAAVINAIAELEPKQYLWAMVTRGKVTLGALKEGKYVGGRRLE